MLGPEHDELDRAYGHNHPNGGRPGQQGRRSVGDMMREAVSE